MKYFLSGLIAIGLSIAAAPSFAADARNVTVVNETGYAIKFLGFNAPDDGLDEWENELEKVLQNEASTYVEFDEDERAVSGTSASTGRATTRPCSGRTSISAR